jgi:hypothetical protein
MANLIPANPLAPTFPDVYELETTDPVQGGPGGPANTPGQNLLERTEYLKAYHEALRTGDPTVGTTVTGLTNSQFTDKAIARTAVNGGFPSGTGRNTVVSGPIDSLGKELVFTAAASNPPNITVGSSGSDLLVSFADGWDENGEKNIIKSYPSGTFAVGGFPGASGTTYNWAIKLDNATLAPTLFAYPLAPVYSRLAPPAPANNQCWFDLNRMQMFQWDSGGNYWVKVYIVFLGYITRTSSTTVNLFTARYNENYGNGTIPVGTIVIMKGTGLASALGYGWLACDGSPYDKRFYPELFNATGNLYGSGSIGFSFNVPNLNSSCPLDTLGRQFGYFIRAK